MGPEVNIDQFERMMAVLNEQTRVLQRIRESQDLGLGAIREQLASGFGPKATPGAAIESKWEEADRVVGMPVAGRPRTAELGEAQRGALRVLLSVLDDSISGARRNHRAMEHRAEPVGDECWRHFHPADIRVMVNDAAREMGIAGFPDPQHPRENDPF
jgi:hypothetical protein